MGLTPQEKRKKFRAALEKNKILIIPGAFDAICAQLVESHGFPATYVSGSATAGAVFAKPDLGLVSLPDMVREAGRIAEVVDIPTLADADTGFGGVADIPHTVAEFEKGGLTGIHIEDQVFPKRCGHLDGKGVIPKEEMGRKIEKAVTSRSDPQFVIIARCDAYGVTGFTDMLDRCRVYQNAGADMIFPEALTTLQEYEKTVRALKIPVLANMTEFGKTPYFTAPQFEEVGCRAVLFPLTVFRTALGTMNSALKTLKKDGSQTSLLEGMFTRKDFNNLIQYEEHERNIQQGKTSQK